MPLLVISLDAVGDHVYEAMAKDPIRYPNIARIFGQGHYQSGVHTIFVSNTYPIHTTVSTGKYPVDHGITSNYLPATKANPKPWAQFHHLIKAKTIWKAAREKKLKTAAFLWPVTCGAPINWHMPEYHKAPKESQILGNLRHGSKWFQLKAFLKHKNQLKGIQQPFLDNFTTNCVQMLLKKKTPDLICVHLIAYDDIFHQVGTQDEAKLNEAKSAIDFNLGKILDAWGDKPYLIFSDHSALNVNQTINLNTYYRHGHFVQNGGSAFTNRIDTSAVDEHWFERYLTKEEMAQSGFSGKFTVGIAAKAGFNFSETEVKGDHGYPPTYPNYQTFYHFSRELAYHEKLQGSIRDVTAIIAKELGLDMDIIKEYNI